MQAEMSDECSQNCKKFTIVTFVLGFLFVLNLKVFNDDGLLVWRRSLPEDIFQHDPFLFLRDFKNPCWLVSGRVACMPYFYVLGVPNVGYRDLFNRIVQHPAISDSSPTDVHWFSRKRFSAPGGEQHMPRLADYVNAFQKPTQDLVKVKNASGIHDMIFGECSDSTFWENDHWEILPENADLLEPKYSTADYLQHLNPDARFLLMIRNPIDRAWSDYMDGYEGDRTDMTTVMTDFHCEVTRMINITQQCLLEYPLRHCAYAPCPAPCKLDLTIGMYSVHLSEYLRWYPRTKIFTIKAEDYFKTVKSHLIKVYEFLKVKPMSDQAVTKIAKRDEAFISRFADQGPAPMFQETRQALYEFYRPYNNELGRLLIQRLNYNREEIWWEEETEVPEFNPKN